MNTEIELKFLVLNKDVNEQTANKITQLLKEKKYTFFCQEKELINSYFDTSDLQLRQLDMGLRVRTSIDQLGNRALEQTIKTSGKIIGGLHQRPEYNVDINTNFPVLSQFPQSIWPDNQNIENLQNQLVSIFTTNFKRLFWQITIEGLNGQQSEIELVFDQGTIETHGKKEALCEIELELVNGSLSDLLILAKVLCFGLKIRPGIKSKAARGYGLWQKDITNIPANIERNTEYQKEVNTLANLALIPLNSPKNLNQVFIHGIDFGLMKVQKLVDAYSENPSLAILNEITEILALLRQGFWLFEYCLDEKMKKLRNELSFFIKKLHWVEGACHLKELTTKTGNYRAKLHYSDSLVIQLKSEKNNFPNSEEIIELFHTARFNRLQLSLLEILLSVEDIIDQGKISEDLVAVNNFAQSSLESSLQCLIQIMPKEGAFSAQQYLAHHKLLIRSLLTGSWFGSLFDKASRLAFRNPWLDIKHGVSELQTILLLQQQLLKLDDRDEKLERWLESKIEHLLLTLEQSRNLAVLMLPYWRN
jgi:triphosphatase